MPASINQLSTTPPPTLRRISGDEETGLWRVLYDADFQQRWLPRFLLLGYLALIFTLTHIPIKPSSLPRGVVNDKVIHFCMFFGLAFLLPLWRGWSTTFTVKQIAGGLLLLLAYAFADELLQIPVGRTCDIMDGVADMLGGTCGLLVAWMVRVPLRSFNAARAGDASG